MSQFFTILSPFITIFGTSSIRKHIVFDLLGKSLPRNKHQRHLKWSLRDTDICYNRSWIRHCSFRHCDTICHTSVSPIITAVRRKLNVQQSSRPIVREFMITHNELTVDFISFLGYFVCHANYKKKIHIWVYISTLRQDFTEHQLLRIFNTTINLFKYVKLLYFS